MRKTRKVAGGVGGPWTLGELVTLAFDVSSSRSAAVKLVQQWTGGRCIHFANRLHPGA
jgi:hypothetical protein